MDYKFGKYGIFEAIGVPSDLESTEVLKYDPNKVIRFLRKLRKEKGSEGADLTDQDREDIKKGVSPHVIRHVQTFILSQARTPEGAKGGLLANIDLGKTGNEGNGVDGDLGPLTWAAVWMLMSWGLEKLRNKLFVDAGVDKHGEEKIVAAPPRKVRFALQGLEEYADKRAVELDDKKEGEDLRKQAQHMRDVIIDNAIERSVSEKIYTNNKVTGYTHLAVEKVYVKYDKVLAAIEKAKAGLNAKLARKVEQKLQVNLDQKVQWAFEQPHIQDRLEKLHKEGKYTKTQAKDIVEKEVRAAALYEYAQYDEDFASLIEKDVLVGAAWSEFETTYVIWVEGNLLQNVQAQYVEQELLVIEQAPLVQQVKGDLKQNTNTEMSAYLSTEHKLENVSSRDVEELPPSNQYSLYLRLCEFSGYSPNNKFSEVDWESGEESDRPIKELEKSLGDQICLFEKFVTERTSSHINHISIYGQTWYMQQLLSGVDENRGETKPVYDNIDFNFEDMTPERNSFMYQGQELSYQVAPSGGEITISSDIENLPSTRFAGPSSVGLTTAMTATKLSLPLLLDLVTQDKASLELYLTQQLTQSMSTVLVQHPVNGGVQEHVRREVEYHTFAKHLQDWELLESDEAESIEKSMFWELLYNGQDTVYLDAQDLGVMNNLLNSLFIKGFLDKLVSPRKFRKAYGLVGINSVGLLQGGDKFRDLCHRLEVEIMTGDALYKAQTLHLVKDIYRE